MKRTQIYLPEQLHDQLGSLARLQHISISEFIRKNLRRSLQEKKTKKKSALRLFEHLIKQGKKYGKKLPKDFSSRHTEYYLETVVPSKSK